MVMTTVSGANIDEVPDIIDAVVKAGADVFAFARYCPTSEEKDVGIEPLRYRRLLAECDRKFKAYEAAGCKTYFNKKDHLWTLYAYETGAFKIPEAAEPGTIYGGCNCGNCHMTIWPTGDLYACRRKHDARGGISRRRLLLHRAGLDGFRRPVRSGYPAPLGHPDGLLRCDAAFARIPAARRRAPHAEAPEPRPYPARGRH